MNFPHLLIRVNEKPELVIVEQKGEKSFPEIRYSLDSLNAMGREMAVSKIGSEVLSIMAYWYTNEFSPYYSIRFDYKYESEIDVITALLTRSAKYRTKMQIPTIQALVDDILRASPEMNVSPTLANWPSIREGFEKYEN